MLLVLPACEREQIEVRAGAGEEAFGRRALVVALDRFTQGEPSPATFREMAVAIAELVPRFNDSVAREAERNLVLLALRTLEALVGEPPEAQLEALGTTVWPTALHFEPAPGESPAAYVERLCSDQLTKLCKHVVPEYRAEFLSALVWSRLEQRASAAVQACDSCRSPEFTETLDRFHRKARSLEQEAERLRTLARPERWPRGGKRSAPWSGVPVVSLNEDGEVRLGERLVSASELGAVLAEIRTRSEVLGVHLEPNSGVRHLRGLLPSVAHAGFTELALQVRAPEYPYALSEYRLAVRASGERTVRMRDIDTAQILVRTLDSLAAKGARTPPGLAP